MLLVLLLFSVCVCVACACIRWLLHSRSLLHRALASPFVHSQIHQSPARQSLLVNVAAFKAPPCVQAPGPNGLTALHVAAASDLGVCCEQLLARGAQVDAEDVHKLTPLEYAVQTRFLDMGAGGNETSQRTCTSSPHDAKTVRVDMGAGGNETSQRTCPSSTHDAKTVRVLLSHGADPAHCDARHRTPVYHAARLGRSSTLQALLQPARSQSGIMSTISIADHSGLQPIHAAVLAEPTSAEDCVLLLLEAGSDPSAATRDGSTPLHLASRRNVTPGSMARLLIEHGALVGNGSRGTGC